VVELMMKKPDREVRGCRRACPELASLFFIVSGAKVSAARKV